jgi:hypothetical protein
VTARGAWREAARRLCFSGWLAGLLVLAVAVRAEAPDDRTVLDAFGRIAFGSEYVADPDPRLQKWTRPIRWRSYEYLLLETEERRFLDAHIARLARLTGLEIAQAESWPEANLAVLFVPEHRYAAMIERYLARGRRHLLPRLAGTTCLGLLRHDRSSHEIEDAVVIIPLDRARARGLATACIAEETTQVMGLLNDSDEVPGTLFNDRGTALDLTPLDELMLRLLYHPRLAAGMRRGEALAVAREVLPALRAQRR